MNTNFEPIRIRAYLQSGVISDQFLPLDGVIYYQLMREAFGENVYSLPNEVNLPSAHSITLPFLIENEGSEDWFYKCSFAQWSAEVIEDQQTYSKRFDLSRSGIVDFGKKKAHVDNQRGTYKSYHVKVYYRHSNFVDWYAVGNRQELEKILPFCTHLGKKVSQGWGAVLKWEVTPWEHDWSIYANSTLMRAIPTTSHGFIYGIRPSYWLPANQVNCTLP